MNPVLWSVFRWWVWVRRARVLPASTPDPIWYFAYGSNMNEDLFRERRHMTLLETRLGHLEGYRLYFTIGGGRRPGISAPANIAVNPDETVHGVLYLLSLRKFARLDASEGRQYRHLWTDVTDADGSVLPAVTFWAPEAMVEGLPSLAYMNLMREAARNRGLPSEYVAFLDQIETRS